MITVVVVVVVSNFFFNHVGGWSNLWYLVFSSWCFLLQCKVHSFGLHGTVTFLNSFLYLIVLNKPSFIAISNGSKHGTNA